MTALPNPALFAQPEKATPQLSRSLTALFAVSVGVIVTNLFAPQTLIGLMAQSLAFPPSAIGLVATVPLVGYASGLFLLVPLADIRENKRLILRLLGLAVLAALGAAVAVNAWLLLPLLFLLGMASSAIQMLVPIAAGMAPPEHRGKAIGDVMGGLMVGILLARPLASLLASAFGWRAFYVVTAASIASIVLLLAWFLPRRQPVALASYPMLIASLWRLLRQEPVLRLRTLSASLSIAAFSLFWTAIALRLSEAPFGLGQRGIAVFALVGAAGAAVAPLAGRLGDRGLTRPVMIASHLLILASLGLAALAGAGRLDAFWSLALMAFAAVLLDIGATGDQMLGRRAINLLNPEARGRLNGLFVGIFFLGGALGAALAGLAWAAGGWFAVCLAAASFGLLALATDLLPQRA